MATKTKAKAKTAERADLLEKEPTQLHQDFADYIQEQTGYEADAKTVQMAVILRMDFQRSEANQSRLQAGKAAREQAAQERADRKAAREAAKSEKASTSKSAPAKKTAAKKSTATKDAPTKKSAPKRRRAAAKTEETF